MTVVRFNIVAFILRNRGKSSPGGPLDSTALATVIVALISFEMINI